MTATPRIVEVTADLVRCPLDVDVTMSFGRMRVRQALTVGITLDDGRTGLGECWTNWPAWAPEERLVLLRAGIAPALLAGDLADPGELVRGLHAGLATQYRQAGSPGLLWQAISAVDQALWDLGPAVADPGRSVGVYASGLGPTGVEADAARAGDLGVDLVKLRVGFDLTADLDNVRAIRSVLGDEVHVAVDANQAYSLDEAVHAGNAFRDAGVRWIEEPVDGDRLVDLERLHDATRLPVATGENVYDLEEFRRRAASTAVAILQPDVTKVGGITRAREVVRLAVEEGAEVMPHMYGGGVGLAATLRLAALEPSIRRVEYDLRPNPLNPLPVPVRGGMAIPASHGRGVVHPDRPGVEHLRVDLSRPEPGAHRTNVPPVGTDAATTT